MDTHWQHHLPSSHHAAGPGSIATAQLGLVKLSKISLREKLPGGRNEGNLRMGADNGRLADEVGKKEGSRKGEVTMRTAATGKLKIVEEGDTVISLQVFACPLLVH